MATELTSLTESEVALIQLRGAAELVTPDEGDIPEMVMDIDRLVADWRRLRIALHDLLHCEVCDGDGILFSEDNQPYACDCRVNAKRALGEE